MLQNRKFAFSQTVQRKDCMIHFFGDKATKVYAVQTAQEITQEDIDKLTWLFGNQPKIEAASLDAFFVGPRSESVN